MRRYCYSPKVYVYVNTGGRVGDKDNPPNIVDLTTYTTAGSVSRVINAVSSAEITIRNPRKKWTKPGKPTFRPMDPITIFMMREKGFPVQVFTGYLNRTPYYAMYPGTVTLSASCTLKRLLHKYFDPALPYTFGFLAEHGWMPNGAGGVVNLPGESADATDDATGTDVITDSGFGKLLYATLREIGGWEDNQIYIEALPDNIASKVSNIFRQFAEEDDQALTDYQNLLLKLIGVGPEGSGGGDESGSVTVGPGSNGKKIFDYFVKRGFSDEQSAGWVGNFVQESGLNPAIVQPNGEGHGLAQWGGGRFAALESFASEKGTKWQDLQTQLDFVWHELQGAESVAYRAIKAARTVHAAVDAIGSKYERYGIKGNRYGPADSAFKLYAGGRGADNVPTGGGPNGDGTLRPADKVEDAGGGSSGSNAVSGAIVGSPVPGMKPQASTHQTAGLSGYPAFDYMSPAGTKCVAPADGKIVKLSGQSPSAGGPAGGALGYSIYLEGKKGEVYFLTHIDKLQVKVGDNVSQGEQMAVVAKGPPSWSTPHVHMGVNGKGAGTIGGGDTTDGGGGGGDDTTGGDMETNANAAAFAAVLNWPSLEEMTESVMMQGRRSLMNDKSLFPFIEQMTGAALRQFQSLPNGVFFAFYPDYFGEMGHRKPYWNIDDVEILDGGIDLTDDNLVTHEFVTGDTVYGGGITLFERLQSGGIVSVFNAFGAVKGLPSLVPGFDGKQGPDAAIAFLKKYGARPEYTEAPMIRSPYFEAFLAYQKFMLAWSRQFATNFTFTFMPELYPGGRVGFPDHGLQCYIESVSHSWDYSGGFTTSAVLSAPSPYGATGDALAYSNGLVRETDGGAISMPNDKNSQPLHSK